MCYVRSICGGMLFGRWAGLTGFTEGVSDGAAYATWLNRGG